MTDTLLLFNVAGISAVLLLMMAFYRHGFDYLWLAVHCAILVAAALAYWFEWAGAGCALAVASMLFVIVPIALTIVARGLFLRQRKAATLRLLKLSTVFHPSLSWRLRNAMEEATLEPTVAAQRDGLDRVIARFSESLTGGARLLRLRLDNDWAGILAFAGHRKMPQIEPFRRMLVIRALGETGRLDEMVGMLLDSREMLASAQLLNSALIGAVQVTGREQALPLLSALPETAAFSEDQRQWMVEVTRLNAGHGDARSHLQELIDHTPDPDAQRLRQEYLDQPRPDPRTVLHPENAAALDGFLARWAERGATLAERRQRHSPATLLLLAANLAAYGLEILTGDPEQAAMLARLGGMWPPYVAQGEWWRLGTALFLHAGWAHLLFNMAILLALGGAYEKRHGWRRMLAVYFGGGLISMAAVFALMRLEFEPLLVLVGASGAIFALLGGLVADMVWRWRGSGMAEDRRTLVFVVFCLLLQTVFDLLIPAVSFSAHASGFTAGFIIGVIFIFFRR